MEGSTSSNGPQHLGSSKPQEPIISLLADGQEAKKQGEGYAGTAFVIFILFPSKMLIKRTSEQCERLQRRGALSPPPPPLRHSPPKFGLERRPTILFVHVRQGGLLALPMHTQRVALGLLAWKRHHRPTRPSPAGSCCVG